MTWWQIALLCWLFFQLGFINATVMERERYWAWMSNSWVMLKRRVWWMDMMMDSPKEATLQDIVELNQNLFRTMHDFQGVFGRPYLKEEWLPDEESLDVPGVDDGPQ